MFKTKLIYYAYSYTTKFKSQPTELQIILPHFTTRSSGTGRLYTGSIQRCQNSLTVRKHAALRVEGLQPFRPTLDLTLAFQLNCVTFRVNYNGPSNSRKLTPIYTSVFCSLFPSTNTMILILSYKITFINKSSVSFFLKKETL